MPYNLYVNKLFILRLLQGVYNYLTRLQEGRELWKYHIFNLVWNKVVTTKKFHIDSHI